MRTVLNVSALPAERFVGKPSRRACLTVTANPQKQKGVGRGKTATATVYSPATVTEVSHEKKTNRA